MSNITSLFAYETLPSLLTVMGASSIIAGLMSPQICGKNENCNNTLSNTKTAGIVMVVGGILLGLLAMLGVLSFGPGYGFGGYGGGYGGWY